MVEVKKATKTSTALKRVFPTEKLEFQTNFELCEKFSQFPVLRWKQNDIINLLPSSVQRRDARLGVSGVEKLPIT